MGVVLLLLAPGCHLLLPLDPAASAPADGSTEAQAPGDGSTERLLPRDGALADGTNGADGSVLYDGPGALDAAGPPPLHGWSVAAGSSLPDSCRAVAVDSQGNVYVAGYYSQSVDVGGGSLPAAGGYQVLVASFSPAGVHRWSHGLGGSYSDYGLAVALDGLGNVYVAGRFTGPSDFGGQTLSATGYDGFVASYKASDGAYRWAIALGGSGQDACYGLAAQGNKLHVTGVFRGDLPLPWATLSTNGSGDVFVVSLDSADGTALTGVQIGGAADDVGRAIAADVWGNLYVGGEIGGPADLGGGLVPYQGDSDLFLLSRSPNGTHRWAKAFGSAGPDVVNGVAVDASGNVAISGQVGGSLDLGGGARPAKGSGDVVVASYAASDGAHRFSHVLGGPSFDGAKQLTVDGAGNLYFTGYFSGGSLGGPPLTTAASDVFVTSLTSSGAHRWSRAFGSAGEDSGLGIAVSGTEVYVGGQHGGSVVLDSGSLTHVGQQDLFLVQLK